MMEHSTPTMRTAAWLAALPEVENTVRGGHERTFVLGVSGHSLLLLGAYFLSSEQKVPYLQNYPGCHST